jgi:Surface antigen variable number repeat
MARSLRKLELKLELKLAAKRATVRPEIENVVGKCTERACPFPAYAHGKCRQHSRRPSGSLLDAAFADRVRRRSHAGPPRVVGNFRVGPESGKIESPGKLKLRRAAMRNQWVRVLWGLAYLSVIPSAQCAKDNREDKKGGILVTDFTITGTQTVSATELARMTGELTGNCFNDDSEEMGERVRALFQNRGYFSVEVKSVKLKAGDPLGTPKPVTMEAEVAEGPKYKVGAITFVKNRAFTAERLRSEFPLKTGAVFERGKVASGIEGLRKVYARDGYLDYVGIPETTPGSNATMDLNLTVEEGPQYRLDKVEFVAKKETISRLQVQWKLAPGSVYDATYVDHYIETNREFLPEGFGRNDVQIATDCPKALVAVRLVVDPGEDASRSKPKDVPCEESHDKAK